MGSRAQSVLSTSDDQLTTGVMKQCAEEMTRRAMRAFLNKNTNTISEYTNLWLKDNDLWVPGAGIEFARAVITFMEGRTFSREPLYPDRPFFSPQRF